MFFGYKLAETSDPLYSHLLRWHNTSRITGYFSDEITSSLRNYNPLEGAYSSIPDNFKNWSTLAQSQFLETSIFMSGYLLSSQGDRVAMGNSVEGRYPFLDYRVMEYASKLPDRYKLNCLNEKFILKRMGAGKIPESILRRSKQAYRAPIHQSFLGQNAPEYVNELLSESNLTSFGYFSPERVTKLTTKIMSGGQVSETENMALAGIISTQLLHHFFITDNVKVAPSDKPFNLKIIRE